MTSRIYPAALKLLHCEFSTARRNLDEINPQPRGGSVTRLDFADDVGKVVEMIKGHDVGQYPVAETKTRTLRDVYGWFSECHSFGEFDEATTTVFARANTLLENLPAR